MTKSNTSSKITYNQPVAPAYNNQYRKLSNFRYVTTHYSLKVVKYGLNFVVKSGLATLKLMTTQTRRSNLYARPTTIGWRVRFAHYLQAWVILLIVLAVLVPQTFSQTVAHLSDALTAVPRWLGTVLWPPSTELAPLFTEQVDYWAADIERWAAAYELDPNLLATVMQIESCGHPNVSSSAGANGLFQVMPFHFDTGENFLDPDTNARRGADFLKQCVGWANGDSGLAMACYNGGPSVVSKPPYNWPEETRRYYQWGTGIYADATQNNAYSQTLNQWLSAGGVYLCDRAGQELGLN